VCSLVQQHNHDIAGYKKEIYGLRSESLRLQEMLGVARQGDGAETSVTSTGNDMDLFVPLQPPEVWARKKPRAPEVWAPFAPECDDMPLDLPRDFLQDVSSAFLETPLARKVDSEVDQLRLSGQSVHFSFTQSQTASTYDGTKVLKEGSDACTEDVCARNSSLMTPVATLSGVRASSYSKACEARQSVVWQSHQVFPDVDQMKQQMRLALLKPEYDVRNFYWETGFCQNIARSHIFENITFLVIFVNAIWMWIDVDYNNAQVLYNAHPIFFIMENFFCVYYTVELAIRFVAFQRKWNCLQDAWFVFDTVLVFLMIGETWCLTLVMFLTSPDGGGDMSGGQAGAAILRLVKLVKLCRLGRMARLLRALPELVILVKGIAVAARSVFFTLFLLVIIIYIFAVMFRNLTGETAMGQEYFSTVPHAMNTLLLDGALPDNAALVNEMASVEWYFWPLIMLYLLLAVLTVMNMLIGVLCDVVTMVAATEKEGLTVMMVKREIREVTNRLDQDGDNKISKIEFMQILQDPHAVKIIQDIGVDVFSLLDLADVIFMNDDPDGLGFDDFLDVMLNLRSTNTATVKDVMNVLRAIKADIASLKEERHLSQHSNHRSTAKKYHSDSVRPYKPAAPHYPWKIEEEIC
jgi:hypothetical protein